MLPWFTSLWKRKNASGKNSGGASGSSLKPRRLFRPGFDALEDRLNLSSLVALDDSIAVHHGQTVTTDMLANDDYLVQANVAVNIATNPGHGSLWFDGADNKFKFTATAGYVGTDSFSYFLTEGTETSEVATVTLNITNTNSTPVDDSYSGHHGQAIALDLLSNDISPDGDSLSLGIAQGPSHGYFYFDVYGPTHYVPYAGYAGTDSFTYFLFDGAENSATATVSFNITNTNSIAVDDSYTLHHGQSIAIDPLANDSSPDGDTLTWYVDQGPAHGYLSSEIYPGQMAFVAYEGYVGTDSFTYHLSDGAENSATATVSFTITNTNSIAADDSYTVHHGQSVVIDPLANDISPDGDTLGWYVDQGPVHGAIYYDEAANEHRYLSYGYQAFVGQDSFTYHLWDGGNNSETVTVTIDVTNTNSTAVDDSYTVQHGQGVVIDPLANDISPDGDSVGWYIDQAPAHGYIMYDEIAAQHRFVTYGYDNYIGPDSFTYHLFDGAENSATATVSFTITAPYAPPSITLSVNQVIGNQVVLMGQVTHSQNPSLEVCFSGVTGGSTIAEADGSFSFTGTLTGAGTVIACTEDILGQMSNLANAEVINAAPSITMSLSYGTHNQVTVTGQVMDEDAGDLTVTLSGVVGGTVTTQGDGTFSFTANATAVGQILAATVDALGQASGSAALTVASNIPAIINFTATNQGANNFWTFRGQVQDEEPAGLSVRLAGLPTLNSSDLVTVDFDGWFSLTVQLQPGEGGFASAVVTDWFNQESEPVCDFV
jgi:hypothetical protein